MTKLIRNPLLEDITIQYDIHGKNPKTFSLPAGEITEIKDVYAEHIIKKVYNQIINDRQLNGIALEADPELKKKLLAEIVVEI